MFCLSSFNSNNPRRICISSSKMEKYLFRELKNFIKLIHILSSGGKWIPLYLLNLCSVNFSSTSWRSYHYTIVIIYIIYDIYDKYYIYYILHISLVTMETALLQHISLFQMIFTLHPCLSQVHKWYIKSNSR